MISDIAIQAFKYPRTVHKKHFFKNSFEINTIKRSLNENGSETLIPSGDKFTN